MSKTRLELLAEFGQSVWFDNISRALISSGELKTIIDKGVKGLTSNPSIFEKSISGDQDYDQEIAALAKSGKSTFEIYDQLTVKDIQAAADIFKPIYDDTNGYDGYVSLEVNPYLSRDSQRTVEEAERLYHKVERENLMVKVPATREGFVAVSELISKGINVNVTLIFSLEQYIKTTEAYMKGLKLRLEQGGQISRVASVASVFVSRIDTVVDAALDKINDKELRGKAAVANSKIIFNKYREIFASDEFAALKNRGANVQRLLWGSTGTKDSSYSDVKYIEELIGKNSINTAPDKTIEAFLDHGEVKDTVSKGVEAAFEVEKLLKEKNILLSRVCNDLLEAGLVAFEKSFDALLAAIEQKAKSLG